MQCTWKSYNSVEEKVCMMAWWIDVQMASHANVFKDVYKSETFCVEAVGVSMHSQHHSHVPYSYIWLGETVRRLTDDFQPKFVSKRWKMSNVPINYPGTFHHWHYRLRPIKEVQFGFAHFMSHFIRVQIFQIDFPLILSASKFFRYFSLSIYICRGQNE